MRPNPQDLWQFYFVEIYDIHRIERILADQFGGMISPFFSREVFSGHKAGKPASKAQEARIGPPYLVHGPRRSESFLLRTVCRAARHRVGLQRELQGSNSGSPRNVSNRRVRPALRRCPQREAEGHFRCVENSVASPGMDDAERRAIGRRRRVVQEARSLA